jgi:hypothetical protein
MKVEWFTNSYAVLLAASDYHKHAGTSEKHALKLLHTRGMQILGGSFAEQ